MKRLIRLSVAALCIVMLAGCGKKGDMLPVEEAKVTSVEVENPTINTVKDEYMYSGAIKAAQTVDVSAKVSGLVENTYFEVGDKVTKGDVLYTIDDTDYQNALKSAQAGLNSANASVQSAKTGVETANGASMQSQIEVSKNSITNSETALETARKSLDDSKIALDKAQSEYDINKQLFDVGGVSEDALKTYKNALENAQNAYSRAELNVKNAENALNQAKSNYDILVNKTTAENSRRAKDALNSALAQQKSAQVSVDNAKQNIANCTVKSPISGTILSKNATSGSMIGGVGYQIVDLSTVNVEVKVSEQIATSVKVGDLVTIKIPSMSDEQFVGSISEIPPGANNDGTYNVKINIPNSTGKLISGMFAEVYFAKSTSNNAVILPRNAVLDENGENYFVYVLDGDKAKKVNVSVGIDTGESIEVVSGLNISDKVITKGQTYLADGDTVNVVSENGQDVEKATPNNEEDKKW